ncbi:amidase [Vibrio nitrifigilis]|uniref:Amidase n=1 Tax=Vibrio nitrifigilis TaxID=2789781 RepID=A0ABS0G9F4_9VIBR|nr:amidase [Vibrio nitrifigilis]MBF8999037.1 amidase [Vibrio nitrifigilis]
MDSDLTLQPQSLVSMLRSIAAGEQTAEQWINACFDRIEAREDAVGAWQHRLTRDEYLTRYQAQQDFFTTSVLKGLPVGIKDIIDTKEMPTEMGSSIHQGRIPADDATCVELIKQAGGIILGKTVTTEFAYFKAGKTGNPVDTERTPGGSSSGSAAAVADNMVPVSVGSQTAASVIRPAAYCGTIGYVASRGELSLRGGQPLAQSLDSLGLYGREVADIQLLRSVLLRQATPENWQSTLNTSELKRVLVCDGSLVGDVSIDMQEALASLAEKLEKQGVAIERLGQTEQVRQLVRCHEQIMAWEVCRNLAYESQFPEQLSEPLQALLANGLAMERSEYLNALRQVQELGGWLNQALAQVDVILTPAAPGVAPLKTDGTGSPHMSRPWQVLGLPTVTIPGFSDQSGLPLGLQLVGQAHDDDALLAHASWVLNTVMTK